MQFYSLKNVKLQITPLKFGSVWILHHKILNFGFYFLKFEDVWILHIYISEYGFYPLKFIPPNFETLRYKIQISLNFRE